MSNMISSKPVLSVKNLTVRLPDKADRQNAVENISFDVQAGKTTCLLGESGSGKSIIAHTVMGLLPASVSASGGSIQLLGEDLLKTSDERLRRLRGTKLAMIFQEPMTALNPVMTCGRQIDEVLALHTGMKRPERKRRILEVFEQTQLPNPERIFGAYPHQLSGGQRQRVMIAMALVLEPALLICDEPTTALDVTTQAEILRLIRQLQQKNGTAVLFITHDFGVVAEIADEVVVLRLGHMVEQGGKLQVLQRPQQAYTRLLLEAVPSIDSVERDPIVPGAPLLEAHNVEKIYISRNMLGKRKELHALQGVSLSLQAGETLGIVGESGSGKSTLARCLATMIEPSLGSVQFQQKDIRYSRSADLRHFRRHVQMVFQDPYRSLNPRQTVGDSIIEGLLNEGEDRAKAWKRAERLMETVRLRPEALSRYPHEFSGGQRQRICIARALACDPKILIADEAVSALDVSVQAQILDLLGDIQKKLHLGLLFITHDLRVANKICDRIIVMHGGQIVEQGVARAVFAQPQHAYTRNLLAAIPGRDFIFKSPIGRAGAISDHCENLGTTEQ